VSARIARRFAQLAREGRAGLVTFTMAGDPDPATALAIMRGLPAAGADLIELGMPFSDPMADGPAVQASGLRALKAGMTLPGTLEIAGRFRAGDADTPVVLMGYYNPIHRLGVDAFVARAQAAGIDGLIIVDLPPEEDEGLRVAAAAADISIIRLITPTTDPARLGTILEGASGFLYYVSVTGVTGTRAADAAAIAPRLAEIRQRTALPIAVGFGIRTPEQAAAIAGAADAVVVGSALVSAIGEAARVPPGGAVAAAHDLVRALAGGVRSARRPAARPA